MRTESLDVLTPALAARADGHHSTHLVQFYDHDAFLVETAARFIGAALGAGDAAVIISTRRHRLDFEARLRDQGLDLDAAREAGRFLALDAAATLSRFMIDGLPDETHFAEIVGEAVGRATDGGHRRVHAFGEMVALLCLEGKRDAAVRLEELWNDLAAKLPLSILCAYPLDAFHHERDGEPFLSICAAHSDVLPAESFTTIDSTAKRLRVVAQLQQKARALETEIAQKKEVEEALRESNQALHALIEASPLPIVVTDAHSLVRLWNPAAERVFGWSAGETLGRPIPIVPPEKLTESLCVREAVARGESFLGVETQRTRRDGTPIDVLVSAAPLADSQGMVREMVLLFEDVTERKRVEAARQRALGEAEAANRAKDEFLAMLGHELRNPLAAVQNAVLTARLDPSRQEQALEIANRGTDKLGRLVDDLLDVARITQGKIVLRRQPLPFAGIVKRALETTQQLVEERGHAVAILTLPGNEIQVDGDPTRLEQVIVNLISNAAKYTEPGGRITLSAEQQGDEVVLRVRDNGMGIAPEMLTRVFDLFAQADRALDRTQGGLGVGLTVVRRLVELHGGRIEAHSDGIGKGAEFVVCLPVAREAQQKGAVVSTNAGARPCPARVLLVEDNADAAESLVMLLELLGHRVRVVNDGHAALEAARANVPDVMLVDIGLPGMDGYELARRVRQDVKLRQAVLVALTGYGRDEDRKRALAAGFDDHLVKPVNADVLRGLVARLSAGAASIEDPILH
jgi:PAS domain S-box-containing protein